ncbi:MAG: hypothetical protein R3E79_38080 [Caldilineaceae bacterium]
MTTINKLHLQSLLAYLPLNRHEPPSRQHLAFLFWPDSAELQALTNLRNLTYILRQALPDPDRDLATGTQIIQWRTDALFTMDVADFGYAAATARTCCRNSPSVI